LRVFENRLLRRIFGTKREEVAGCWRRLHNEDLHNLYTSPSIIKAMRTKFWSGNINGMYHLGNLSVDRKIIYGDRG